MAKVVGIDPGEFAVKTVMLEGSYKKTRLVRCQIEPMPEDVLPGERAEMVAETTRHALKEGHIAAEDVRLGYPCREAVLRTIEVPFTGRDAIRRIIKSEVEGAIHSHSVDDMVVDFHEVGKVIDGSKVLVAAVPKGGLRALLQALEKKSIEPQGVDLDTMALYRVAHWCGAFHASAAAAAEEVLALEDEDGEEAAPPPLPVPAIAPGVIRTISAVLDLGARSTRVILVENGHLVEMRTLRVGDSAIVDELARNHGLSPAQAREVMTASLASGADQHVDVADLAVAPAEEGAEAGAATARQVTVPYTDVESAQTTLLQRLAREFARFLVSVGDRAKVETLWITGGASQLQGMREMLQEVFGVEPRQLDVMGRVQHNLSPEEAESIGPRLSIAIGLALAGLGGPVGFNLRQEDLVFTRGFDRVKFPLAITCMVALFAMVVWGVKLNNDLKNLEFQIGRTYMPDGKAKEPSFYGMLLATFPGGWFNDPTRFPKEKYNALLQELVAAPVDQRLNIVRKVLSKEVEKQQSEWGIYEDLSLESGLAVLVRFSEMLERHKGELGRFLVTRMTLNLGNNNSNRSLDVTVAFRGSDFQGRTGLSALKAAITEECSRPDSPFANPDGKSTNLKEELFKDSEESGVQGAYYIAHIAIKDEFQPFP